MQFLIKFLVSLVLLLSLSACFSQKPAPKIVTDRPVTLKEDINTTKKTVIKKYSLRIKRPAGAKVRILNIVPKYHDNIRLPAGRYLIEVRKRGFKKYKKWVELKKESVLSVKLKPLSTIYDTHYFNDVTEIEWKNNHDLFSLVYDKKTKLIWALQSSYVDYVIQNRINKLIHDIVKVEGKPWPTIQKTKVDTLIYSGYFRYKGINFLFKNRNSIDLYKAEGSHALFKSVADLDSLEINSMKGAWRLPKASEVALSNPFKKYQKYFEIYYKRYKEMHFNLPILCIKRNTLGFYSQWSIAYKYNAKKRVYSGKKLDTKAFFALKHAKNFALVVPVKKISNRYEKIIFDTRVQSDEKLAAVTNLLVKEALKRGVKISRVKLANKMASKAMNMVFGDPKIVGNRLYSSTNSFYKRVRKSKKVTKVKSVSFRVLEGDLEIQTLK
jgi:hypothetical protein